MLLTKDGITVDVENPVEIARLKRFGYKEVEAPVVVESEVKPTPEEENVTAIEEANKPIGSKKAPVKK